MTFTPVKFEPTEFRFDSSVFNKDVSPEMKSISVPTSQDMGYDMKVIKSASQVNLKVRWILNIQNSNRDKQLLYYEGEDLLNLSSIGKLEEETEAMKAICNDSFTRFSDYFDFRKLEPGLDDFNLELFPDEIDHFCLSLKAHLRNAGY
jgi:hypothetical protein